MNSSFGPRRIGHHLRQVWSRLRKERALAWAGICVFTCSCSFNNSFQDGCLGTVKVTVPADKLQQQDTHRKARRKAPDRVRSDRVRSGRARSGQFASFHQERKLSARVIDALPASFSHALLGQPSAPNTATQRKAHPNAAYWWESETFARAYQVFATLAQDSGAVPTSRLFLRVIRPQARLRRAPLLQAEESSAQKIAHRTLFSPEPRAIWKERPNTIRLCYHLSGQNKGWGRLHVPRNSERLHYLCQSGYALGKGRQWYVINNTFAASGIPCRLFLSLSRLHVVAQCGRTVYRALIRKHAQCLQTSKRCLIPSATLHKQPPETIQSIEFPRTPER